MEFVDRRDAGRRLAAELSALGPKRPIVVALPRGGVPVAYEVAVALDAPLEILAVRKLGAPGNPEFAVGAIAEDGTAVVNAAVARRVGMSSRVLDATIEREAGELARGIEHYRAGRPALPVKGRTGHRRRRWDRDGADRSRGGPCAASPRRGVDRRRRPGRAARFRRDDRPGGRRRRVPRDAARPRRRRPLVPRLHAGRRRGGGRAARRPSRVGGAGRTALTSRRRRRTVGRATMWTR